MRALIEDGNDAAGIGDLCDRASEQEQLHLAVAIRMAKQPLLPPRGACLFCDADLSPYFDDSLRWCPVDPGEDPEHACVRLWEREQERRRANT